MLTIYTLSFNEALILPHFIRHYRDRFPGCRIVVYDNYSTDDTVKIAKLNDCEVIMYDTGNKLDDMKYLEIKNHCWQGQKERWAIVVDCDELCEISHYDLTKCSEKGATILRFQGYNMVNHAPNLDITNMVAAVKDDQYSKSYCFDTRKIKEINYNPGCHKSNPVGEVVYSEKIFPCYHYKYINATYLVDRYKRNAHRMNAHGKKTGMGSHYHQREAAIRADFAANQQIAIPIRKPMPNTSLKICVSGFDESQFNRVHGLHLEKVNLSRLALTPHLQDNRLSEHRLFMSGHINDLNCDYTGNITWRWHQKCKHLMPMENLWQLPLADNVVWCGWLDSNWYRKSIIDHKGLQKYLVELVELTGLSIEGAGPLANQFICSKKVYLEFQDFFATNFIHFHNKYGFEYDFWVKESDKNRLPAVFYERFAALYFANRKDLIIKQIPNK